MGIVFATFFLRLGIKLATAAHGESHLRCCMQAVFQFKTSFWTDNRRRVAFLGGDHRPLCRHHIRQANSVCGQALLRPRTQMHTSGMRNTRCSVKWDCC